MMKKTSLFTAITALLFCVQAIGASLKPGTWRFEMRAAYGNVPFLIEITQKGDKYSGVLKNGKEDIKLSRISVSNKGVSIPLQTYEMSLEMDPPKEGKMTGYLIRHNKNPVVKTAVVASYGETERFPGKKSEPTIDLTGRWSATLIDEENKKEPGVLVFEQKGNHLTGSILTPTGDYRYMEGYVDGAAFAAASFDGVYNYIFTGEVKDGSMKGTIAANYRTKVEASRNEKAELPDAYAQTKLQTMSFRFPNLAGKLISLNDKQFKGKPVIVQFFGSWCPNCLDEMNYMIPWYNKNHKRGIEVVALAFERSLSYDDARKQLLKTVKRRKVPYTVLLAGATSEDKPKDKIPTLENFISFPTTVFLNKNHEVVKVHAGFTGPSTGEFYERWQKEFNETVDGLLKK